MDGGISNSLEVIEQVTYLLFIKRLDEIQTRDEARTNRLRQPIENPLFPPGDYVLDHKRWPYESLRWSRFKNAEPRAMYDLITDAVFPFVKSLGSEESAFAVHMRDARFTLPPEKAGLLAKGVALAFLEGVLRVG